MEHISKEHNIAVKIKVKEQPAWNAGMLELALLEAVHERIHEK